LTLTFQRSLKQWTHFHEKSSTKFSEFNFPSCPKMDRAMLKEDQTSFSIVLASAIECAGSPFLFQFECGQSQAGFLVNRAYLRELRPKNPSQNQHSARFQRAQDSLSF